MKVCMIMVMDTNRLIGRGGTMPWHLPTELQYFKEMTDGKPVIMGRKTYQSIGHPLPDRHNIVVTSRDDFLPKGVQIAGSLSDALRTAETHLSDNQREVMIIGGAVLCREAMPLTEKLYLTEIQHAFEGDTWLDSYDPIQWREISSHTREADGYTMIFRVLERA